MCYRVTAERTLFTIWNAVCIVEEVPRDDSQSGITSGWLTCPCQLSPAAGFQVDSCYLVTGQTKQAVVLLKLCLRCDNFSYFLADDRVQKKNAFYNYKGMINLIKRNISYFQHYRTIPSVLLKLSYKVIAWFDLILFFCTVVEHS